MSKIKFQQISEDVLEVFIPEDTPVEMAEQLAKSFREKGLVEDRDNSTLCVRYYYRPEDKANDLADQLIKSLQGLAKDDEPYWTPKSQFANQKRVREMEIAERRAKNGIKQPTNVSTAPEPHVVPDKPVTMPKPKLHDSTPAAQVTAGGSGRRYGTMIKQEDHVKGCQCDACLEMEKSNYGPKGGGQYSAVDNARRKANNLDPVGMGPNVNAKAYSTKPGQMSGKAQADLTARIQAKANKKQPVKQWTPEQIAAENEKRGLKKGWGEEHNPIPNADEEVLKLQKNVTLQGEEAAANQLLKLMMGKSMLGQQPPPQPTDEQMFGGGVVTEEMAKAAEGKWNNTINNWLAEATKPISQRFASEAEELAYWNSLKINGDRDDGSSGY